MPGCLDARARQSRNKCVTARLAVDHTNQSLAQSIICKYIDPEILLFIILLHLREASRLAFAAIPLPSLPWVSLSLTTITSSFHHRRQRALCCLQLFASPNLAPGGNNQSYCMPSSILSS